MSITVKIENSEDETRAEESGGPQVIVTASGEGAAAWARHQQSLAGSHWECDGSDFAYVIIDDSPTLVEDVTKEIRENDEDDVEIDDGEYYPLDLAE